MVGCKVKTPSVYPDLDMNKPVLVTDEEVLKELEFLRDEGLLREKDYQIILRMENIPMKKGRWLTGQVYPSCFNDYCKSNVYTRPRVQVLIKEQDITGKPILVTDPQVLKELEFMRYEKLITEKDYQIMLRRENIPSDQDKELRMQSYPSCFWPTCDVLNGRDMIQGMMKEKDIYHEYITKPILITDPQVLKELEFMRDDMIINEYNYQIMLRMNDIPNTITTGGITLEVYPICFLSGCDVHMATRRSIQKRMQNISEGKNDSVYQFESY